jgi:uncharacterized protein
MTAIARSAPGRRLGWPATMAGGMMALAVGAGLGPRHMDKEGASATALLGVVLLAAGVAVAAWAAFHILRDARRRWWPLIGALLLVAGYVTLWTLGQAVAASYAPRTELGERTPTDVGLAYRDVTFPSSDGVMLAGWYLPSRNGAAVGLMHGAGSTRSSVLDHAEAIARHGYGVLLFDARGHGESAGRGMDFGWHGEADAAGAVDFLTQQAGVSAKQIGLVGLSMGGEQAIGAAGVDERVAAVVAEGATNRVAADKEYLAVYGVRGELQQWLDRLTYATTDLLSDAPRPPALRHSVALASQRTDPAAFLLITAGRVPDEGHAADYIRGPSRTAVRVWTVPGAGHTQGLEAAPAEWEERVSGFLDQHLEGAGR